MKFLSTIALAAVCALTADAQFQFCPNGACPDQAPAGRFRNRTVLRSNTFAVAPSPQYVNYVAPPAAAPVSVKTTAKTSVTFKSTETYSCDSSAGPLARIREAKPVRSAAITIASLPVRVLARIFGRCR